SRDISHQVRRIYEGGGPFCSVPINRGAWHEARTGDAESEVAYAVGHVGRRDRTQRRCWIVGTEFGQDERTAQQYEEPGAWRGTDGWVGVQLKCQPVASPTNQVRSNVVIEKAVEREKFEAHSVVREQIGC